MKNDATKHFSNIQENMIADYLNWDVVVGSGARNFHPGDIISDRYLGECKTHVERTAKIYFNHSVWLKIKSEAMSKFKVPVVFTDNGTQNLRHTWCIISARDCDCLNELNTFKIKSKHINVNESELFEKLASNLENCCLSFTWNDEDIYLMHIFAFKHMIENVG
jgi:hypothetical protein